MRNKTIEIYHKPFILACLLASGACGPNTKRKEKCKLNCPEEKIEETQPRQTPLTETNFGFWETTIEEQFGQGKTQDEINQIVVGILNTSPLDLMAGELSIISDLADKTRSLGSQGNSNLNLFEKCLVEKFKTPVTLGTDGIQTFSADFGKCFKLSDYSGVDRSTGYSFEATQLERAARFRQNCLTDSGTCDSEEFQYPDLESLGQRGAIFQKWQGVSFPRFYRTHLETSFSSEQVFTKNNQKLFKVTRSNAFALGASDTEPFESIKAAENTYMVNGQIGYLTSSISQQLVGDKTRENLKGIKLHYAFNKFIIDGSDTMPSDSKKPVAFLGDVQLKLNKYTFKFIGRAPEKCLLDVFQISAGSNETNDKPLGQVAWCQEPTDQKPKNNP